MDPKDPTWGMGREEETHTSRLVGVPGDHLERFQQCLQRREIILGATKVCRVTVGS